MATRVRITARLDWVESMSPCTRASSRSTSSRSDSLPGRVANSACRRSRNVVAARKRASVSMIERVKSSVLTLVDVVLPPAAWASLSRRARNVASQRGSARRLQLAADVVLAVGVRAGAEHLAERRAGVGANLFVRLHHRRDLRGRHLHPIGVGVGEHDIARRRSRRGRLSWRWRRRGRQWRGRRRSFRRGPTGDHDFAAGHIHRRAFFGSGFLVLEAITRPAGRQRQQRRRCNQDPFHRFAPVRPHASMARQASMHNRACLVWRAGGES